MLRLDHTGRYEVKHERFEWQPEPTWDPIWTTIGEGTFPPIEPEAHLLKSQANATRLLRSIADANDGKFVRRPNH
jgi:hypothetical protein